MYLKAIEMKKNIIVAAMATALFFSCQKGVHIPNEDESKPETSKNDSSSYVLPVQLSKGINLSNWFEDASSPDEYNNLFTPEHFRTIKKSGFTYVRIPIGRTILFQPANPSVLNPTNLLYVDKAVKMATDAGLAVLMDYHPSPDYNMNERQLFNNPSAINAFVLYWKAVATYFKKYSPSQIFFEVYNEQHAAKLNSQLDQWQWWWPQQQKIVETIREITAQHYIIVGAEGYSNISYLIANKPYSVPRIIYNFHFYQPYVFTHQGASWIDNSIYPLLHSVPYPSTPQNVAPLIAETSDTAAKNILATYGSIGYNVNFLDNVIKEASDWAHAYHVPLICDEFGVYKKYAPTPDRLRYLHDVKSIFDKYNIGWAMWDFDGKFGFVTYPSGNRQNIVADESVLNALGL